MHRLEMPLNFGSTDPKDYVEKRELALREMMQFFPRLWSTEYAREFYGVLVLALQEVYSASKMGTRDVYLTLRRVMKSDELLYDYRPSSYTEVLLTSDYDMLPALATEEGILDGNHRVSAYNEVGLAPLVLQITTETKSGEQAKLIVQYADSVKERIVLAPKRFARLKREIQDEGTKAVKITLKEVRKLVESMLRESVCTKCGYDNPFMDDDPNYVCRQCKVRAEKLGGQPNPEDLINTASLNHDDEEDLDQDEEDENPYGYTDDDLCSKSGCNHYVDDLGLCTDPNCSCCGRDEEDCDDCGDQMQGGVCMSCDGDDDDDDDSPDSERRYQHDFAALRKVDPQAAKSWQDSAPDPFWVKHDKFDLSTDDFYAVDGEGGEWKWKDGNWIRLDD